MWRIRQIEQLGGAPARAGASAAYTADSQFYRKIQERRMQLGSIRRIFNLILVPLVLFTANPALPQTPVGVLQPAPEGYRVRPEWVLAHEEFLASDVLHGRGSGTRDEFLAATYIGSELREFGVEPAGDDGGYVQRVRLIRKALTKPPVIVASSSSFVHGKDMLAAILSGDSASGPLKKVKGGADTVFEIKPGEVALLSPNSAKETNGAARALLGKGAAAVIIPDAPQHKSRWAHGDVLPTIPPRVAGAEPAGGITGGLNIFILKAEAFQAFSKLADGTPVKVEMAFAKEQESHTWNAVGKISGSGATAKDQTILLTAHLDHLGIHEGQKGDNIYNGADDDASGCTAVLELARALGAGAKPARTVVFAFFGSEEEGGFGASYFLEHPPVPIEKWTANLEFEMIGRPDSAVSPHTLWLTGYERTTLGPELARHGAKLVQDPHPAEDFFRRSDNYVLAKRGIVAQTVSSYGLHKQYHQPDDDISHLDITHMTDAISSMVGPVIWLVNSDYTPEWLPGKKP